MADSKPTVELFIRASNIEKGEKACCVICQQFFMVFYTLSEKNYLNLIVTTVNLDAPPAEYTALHVARRLPVARVVTGFIQGQDLSNHVYETNDEIEKLASLFGYPMIRLARDSPEERAEEKVFEDLYTKFCNLIRNANDTSGMLLNILRKLDAHLRTKPTKYLLGDELSYADCLLMPRLQHVRVAGKAFKRFEVPGDLLYVWKYYAAMYETQAFLESCPLDRDLISQYEQKTSAPLPTRASLMGEMRSLEIPSYVLAHLEQHTSSQ